MIGRNLPDASNLSGDTKNNNHQRPKFPCGTIATKVFICVLVLCAIFMWSSYSNMGTRLRELESHLQWVETTKTVTITRWATDTGGSIRDFHIQSGTEWETVTKTITRFSAHPTGV